MSYLSTQLIKTRSKRNMTQEQVAELIGVSHCTISAWERDKGEPASHYLSLIAKFTGVSAIELRKGGRHAKKRLTGCNR